LVHEIDYALWLFGRVRRVGARLENTGIVGLPRAIDESAALVLEHESSLMTNVRLSYAIRPASRKLRVWGERGMLEWDGIARRARRVDVGGAELESHAWTGPHAMYRAQADAWIALLREPGSTPASGLADVDAGLAALEVLDAARASHRTSAWSVIA